MNVYEKLQTCRLKLQQKQLKKSGKNTFAGYDYFELGDFLPSINELFLENKLFSHIGFNEENATLTILNTEKPEENIVFTSPMKEVNLKGAHSIQNAGAVQTYQRRYLYLMALEIVESDTLDATQGKDKPTGNKQRPNEGGSTNAARLSDKQKKLILDKLGELSKQYGVALNEIIDKKMKSGDIPKPIEQLSIQQASSLITKMKTWGQPTDEMPLTS